MFHTLSSFIISIWQTVTTFFLNNKHVPISFQNNQLNSSLFPIAMRSLCRRIKSLPKRHLFFIFSYTYKRSQFKRHRLMLSLRLTAFCLFCRLKTSDSGLSCQHLYQQSFHLKWFQEIKTTKSNTKNHTGSFLLYWIYGRQWYLQEENETSHFQLWSAINCSRWATGAPVCLSGIFTVLLCRV